MNEKQKDNLAKFAYDLGKIVLAITVVTPMARPDELYLWSTILGVLAGVSVVYFGYLLDSVEVENDNI